MACVAATITFMGSAPDDGVVDWHADGIPITEIIPLQISDDAAGGRPAFRYQLIALDQERQYLSGGRTGEHFKPLREAGCAIHVVPEAGHLLMWENLDGFAAALAAATGLVRPA